MSDLRRRLRIRFRIEVAFAVITGFLTILTLITREWIEAVFGVDPDHGNGSLEWLLVGVFAVCTVALALVARADYRRLATA